MKYPTRYPSLKGRAIFITGGATGIGAELVTAFAWQGSKVAFIDCNEPAAMQLIRDIEAETTLAPWFEKVDVAQISQLQAAIKRAATTIGPIDTLVNNVANDERHDPMDLDHEGWHQCMAVNLDAAFFSSQAVFPYMKEEKHGSIINLSSINALLGPANMAGYVTAKAGLIGMTKALAKDWGSSSVRVNAILPGWVATDRQLEKWLSPEVEQEWSKQVAIKRRLLATDVANLALFLAADESAMITGQSLTIDGGRT